MFDKFKQLFAGGSSAPRVDIKKRFKLLGKSGMGSMSQVFRAKDAYLKREVCLKILDKEKTAAFENRFVGLKRPSEGAISMELQHSSIVETLEHGLTTGNEQYIVQEWLDGSGLHMLLERNNEALAGNRAKILIQVAEALEYMHKQKYLHRDICPRNVIVVQGRGAKLIDFGLSLPYRPEFCKPGNRTGTVQYLAPEIIKRSTTDHRVDLFALGVTAYQTYAGNLPWGNVESIQTLMSHMNDPGKDPRSLRPELDEGTAQFLMKAIEREPARRFQTATQFREALKALPGNF